MRSPLLIFGLLLLTSGAGARCEQITVSAAISLKEAIAQAAAEFEKASGDHVQLVFGSSGQLAAQIENGAPVDLFISAAQKQVDDLKTAGLLAGRARVIARNSLVLIAPADAASTPRDFKDLAAKDVVKVAIGDPKTVPAGQYAMQTLEALHLREPLTPRLVYGLNVRQVLDYVERSEVSAGIVYGTDARQAGDKVKVVATADPAWHAPIVYPAAVVKGSAHAAAAERFVDYLRGEKGQAALIHHGFAAAELPTTRPTP